MKFSLLGLYQISRSPGACESMNIDSHTAYDYILNMFLLSKERKSVASLSEIILSV